MLKPLFLIGLGVLMSFSLLAANEIYHCGSGLDKESITVLFRKPSLFGDVLVVDSDSKRYLRFGDVCGADQSSIDLLAPDKVIVEYVRNASLSLIYAQNRQAVLVVGMGGGVFSNLLARNFPDIEIDAIEIDPVVVDVAKEYFGVKTTENYRIHIQDAADFIMQTNNHYDVIFLDAYDGDGIPEHLTDKTFFTQVAKLLKPGGVVVANFGLDSPVVYLMLAKRLREAVGATLCLHGKQEPNLVVIAGSSSINKVNPVIKASELEKQLSFSYSLSEIAKQVKDCPKI